MPKKLQGDDDDLMEIFQQHYAELRREHSEYKDTVHKLECEVAGLRGRVDQLEELNKCLTEERDQFLERYYQISDAIQADRRRRRSCTRQRKRHDWTPTAPAGEARAA